MGVSKFTWGEFRKSRQGELGLHMKKVRYVEIRRGGGRDNAARDRGHQRTEFQRHRSSEHTVDIPLAQLCPGSRLSNPGSLNMVLKTVKLTQREISVSFLRSKRVLFFFFPFLFNKFIVYLYFFFYLFRATPVTYGSSQARDRIGATDDSLCC